MSIAAFYCQSPYDGIDESQASLNSQNLMGLKAHLSNTDVQKPPKSCIQPAKSCLICLTLSSGRFGPAGVLNRGFATGVKSGCLMLPQAVAVEPALHGLNHLARSSHHGVNDASDVMGSSDVVDVVDFVGSATP